MQRREFRGQGKKCPMSDDYSAMLLPKASWKQTERKKPAKEKATPAKKRSKKRKHKKRKSIMQPKTDRRCYLCMLLDGNFQYHSELEEHHVLFGNTKWISDEYGLRVNLCIPHHRTGKAAVHNNNKNAKLLMRIAQNQFMERYPELDWMEIVRENYLEDEDETT